MILYAVCLAAVMMITAILFGRRVTLLAGSAWGRPVEQRPVTSFTYSPHSLQAAGCVLEINSGLATRIADGKLQLIWQGRTFVLGPVKTEDPIESDVTPESGDEASLEVEHSLLSWPTPLEMNFMTGVSPSWKRYRYYNLVWKKYGGETMRATWRYEQWYYPSGSWSGDMTTPDTTGFIGAQFSSR
jgi:hypothetical protein